MKPKFKVGDILTYNSDINYVAIVTQIVEHTMYKIQWSDGVQYDYLFSIMEQTYSLSKESEWNNQLKEILCDSQV